MPVISAFFGIIIRIYYSDHNPPHFHAQYGDHEVIIEIKSGRVLKGKLPTRLQYFLELWRRKNADEIMEAWDSAQHFKVPKRVKPLE
jgi:hypothetical protein